MNQDNNYNQSNEMNNQSFTNEPQMNGPTVTQAPQMSEPINNTQPDNYVPPTQIQSEPTPPKKKNTLIIILLVIVVLIVLGVIFIPKLLNKSSESGGSSTNNQGKKNTSNTLNTNLTGVIGETNTIEGYKYINKCGNFFYELNNGTKVLVVDSSGKQVASSNKNSYESYCFKDGTIFMPDETVWRNGEKIFLYTSSFDSSAFYENDVLYYNADVQDMNLIKAYDLKNNKELWSAKGSDIEYVIDDYLVFNGGKAILNKKTGEIIAQEENGNSIQAGYEYYVKYKKTSGGTRLESLEIYNFKNELISKNKLTYDDDCYLTGMYTNGFYSIDCYNDNNKGSYLYNPKSELIQKNQYIGIYKLKRLVAKQRFNQINEIDTKDFSAINLNGSYYNYLFIYSDGRTIDYKSTASGRSTKDPLAYIGNEQEKKVFVLGKNPDNNDNYLLYNYEIAKSVDVKECSESETLYGNKYAMVKDRSYGDIKTFYDYNLNKLQYEINDSNISVYPLNNKWIIRLEKNENKFYFTDITTGNEKQIDIKINEGESLITSNVNSIVVGSSSNQKYTFYHLK